MRIGIMELNSMYDYLWILISDNINILINTKNL